MLRVISHIEQLLQLHDCVIVPGIGGFVSQVLHATYNPEKHLFIPMHKEIVFNGSLHHNDGLLTEAYMKTYQVDFNEARQMLEEDVAEVNTVLKQHTTVSIGTIGKLMLSDSGQLLFEAETNSLNLPETYGLAVLQLKTVQDLQREEVALLTALQKQDKDTIYIPIRKRALRSVAATAAAIALFFLVSTPVKDVDKNSYAASLFPTEIITTNPVQQLAPDTEVVPGEVSDIVEAEAIPEVEVVAPVPEPVAVNKKMYHIIIGSFVTHKQADDFIEEVDQTACPRVEKIIRDERIRVYADKFDNRDDAEQFLETLRQNPRYKDAWLFISR